jgi:hypothetical protein
VSLEAPATALLPGATAAVAVRVSNPGSTVESYRIDVVGPARAWACPPAEPMALFPGASGVASVTFTTPAHGGPRAGIVRVGVRVVAVSAAGGAAVEEFDLVIGASVCVTAKLIPTNSRGWRKGHHRVEVTNGGNVDTSVTICAGDADEQLQCRVDSPTVVAAGTTTAVHVVVVSLSSRMFGHPEVHPFAVDVVPDTGEGIVLSGSLRQRPLLGARAPVMALAMLAVLAALITFVMVSRSGPRSAARDSANVVNARLDAVPTSTTTTTAAEPTTTVAPAPPETVAVATTVAAASTPSSAPTTRPHGASTSTTVAGDPPATTAAGNDALSPLSPVASPAPAVPADTTTAPASPAPATVAFELGPTYAGDGVIYAVSLDGKLLFFRDLRQNGTSNGQTGEGWSPAGGSQIGCGFGSVQHLIGAEGGMFYAVDSSGNFRWYKDLARDGSNNACAGGGAQWAGGLVMGVGWQGYKHVFYGGNGIIYAIDPSGNLRFCQDVGLDGSFNPPVCPVIGTGWGDFRQVFASGAPGVIYAIRQDGELDYYRDMVRNGTNLQPGVNGWIGPLPVGHGWQNMRSVFGGAINSSVYPNGVVYGIGDDYNLRWWQDVRQDGSNGIGGNAGWLGPSVVGISWNVL